MENKLRKAEYMGKYVIIVLGIIFLIFIGFLYKKLNLEKEINKDNVADFYFLGIDEADSIIIKYNKYNIMIDTGEEKDRGIILSKLKELDINKIDYMILTHPDKDHIGNAKYIIENFKVDKIIQSDFDKGTKLQLELNETISRNKIENIVLKEQYEVLINEMKFEIFPGNKEKYKKSNDNSLFTIITLKDKRLCFAGDVEKQRIEELLEMNIPRCDVLKIPHHGRDNELSESLIDKIFPKIAIVTAKTAEKQVEDKLEKIGCKVYYTGNCEIHIRTDGNVLNVKRKLT